MVCLTPSPPHLVAGPRSWPRADEGARSIPSAANVGARAARDSLGPGYRQPFYCQKTPPGVGVAIETGTGRPFPYCRPQGCTMDLGT